MSATARLELIARNLYTISIRRGSDITIYVYLVQLILYSLFIREYYSNYNALMTSVRSGKF